MNNEYKRLLDDAARTHVPETLDLFPRLAERLRPKPLGQALRARPVLAILVAILVILLLTGVAYAIGRAMGYVPGVGFVETGSLRVLAEPVSQTRKGVTVTIAQVVADSERTVVVYGAEGLTIAAANSKGEGGGPFGSRSLLRLPDRSLMEEIQGAGYAGAPEPLIDTQYPKGGWPNYRQRLVYPPINSDINQLTLVVPILQNMPLGAAPENWELTFRLKPAPPDMTMVPITMLAPPSQSVGVTPSAAEGSIGPALSNVATRNGFALRLESIVELADGYVFTGRLTWTDAVFPTGKGVVSGLDLPILTDAQGQRVPIEEVRLDASYTEREIPWSYRTNRKAFSGPLVLSIPSLNTVAFAPDVPFEADLGSNVQIGQTWEINRNFVVEGHTFRLLSVQLVGPPDPCWRSGLEFKFTGDGAAIPGSVNDVVPDQALEKTCSGGGGGGGPTDPTIFYTLATYSSIPTGLHRFSMSVSLPIVVDGPWQVAWQPPSIPGPTPTAEPEACLTLEKWNQIKGQNDPLPASVGGQILVSVDAGVPSPMTEPAPSFPEIQISRLDGSNRSRPVRGGSPALSPDGTHLIYIDEKGLHLLDLLTREGSLLRAGGYSPVWSPDGSWIFTSSSPGLIVMKADGSGSQVIDVGGAEITPLVGWLPDNQTVIYSYMTGKGFAFVERNLLTGATHELPLTVQNKWGYGAPSPDGQWMAFMDRVFGAQSYGVFISHLDGSDRRLVVSGDIPISYRMAWSPDSRWLLVNTTDYQQPGDVPAYRPVLIELENCRAVGLPDPGGYVEGWVK